MDEQGMDDFIDLDRTFRELGDYARESDEVDVSQAFRRGEPITWAGLKAERRAVLLAEAGAGKTEEMRQAARRWRANGDHAFFLRLEHVADDLDIAFEEGDLDGFERWKACADEAWILLDSVDEARLRGPQDFERAIRKFAIRVRGAEDRLHLLISSRMTAWRPKTDLEFCERHLPPPTIGRRARTADDLAGRAGAVGDVASEDGPAARPRWRVLTIDDLDKARIEKFARAADIKRLDEFLDAVERRDAWAYTRRPQDLVELIEFWRGNGRLGSRLELMEASVARRLTERKQGYAEWQLLANDRARDAARRIAAACILAHEATIRVPDGTAAGPGLEPEAVLPDWDAKELGVLLARPLFDVAIYGAVRFHHREAREYLAAEWFADLLRRETSRTKIEALFFRRQYEMDVIAPAMRPVLPWLALRDDRVRERLLRVSPEVLFEGGDPSQLPKPTREAILRDCCNGLAATSTPRTFTDYAAIQRFAALDLVGTMRELLRVHADSHEVTSFLCRMVWIGVLTELRPEVRAIALRHDASSYTRVVAVRALAAILASGDLMEVREKALTEIQTFDRDLLAELVTATLRGPDDVEWLVSSLRAADPPRPHTVDRVAEALKERVATASLPLLQAVVEAFAGLLAEEPHVDAAYCPVSQTWAWLATVAGKAVARLIAVRDGKVLEPATLGLLRRIGLAKRHIAGLHESKSTLGTLVKGWEELSRGLFWHEVESSRRSRPEGDGRRVAHFVEVFPSSGFWGFSQTDFDYFIEQITARSETDDRLVALSVAFALFRDADRPENWRERLLAQTEGEEALRASLSALLDPPLDTEEVRRWRRQEQVWKLRSERRQLEEARRRQGWRDGLRTEIDRLRDSGLNDPPRVSQSQWYLLDRLRETDKDSNRWTNGNWEALVEEFGTEVAEAFRDGALGFWRRYDPPLRSEGAAANTTPAAHVFGLAGLAMEARQGEQWAARLSAEEAERATRYAVGELNGFPTWLPQLFVHRPDPVLRVLMVEIEHQVMTETADEPFHYVLDDVAWAGSWCWDALAPRVVKLLGDADPRRAETLSKLLTILHGSTVPDDDIADLAARGVGGSSSTECRAVWFASLIGVVPEKAIPLLRSHLDGMNDPGDRTRFAMQVVTHLVGGRIGGGIRSRQRFVAPRYLADLHALMHEHIRRQDDIDRVGGGVYSPELRDHAQDARNGLLGLLDGIPGKAAFVALLQLANTHPDEGLRPHLMLRAARRAEADSDLPPWDVEQFVDFASSLERVPRNHRELADLVLMRFLDVKAELEGGDESIAPVLRRVHEETEMRNFLARELRARAQGRYHLPQESELADGKRPDLRFHGNNFDAPVPVELKLADRWTGPNLLERLENQLCGDYLRDARSRRGLFVLVHNGSAKAWMIGDGVRVGFEKLVEALEARWKAIARDFPDIDDVRVVGINLPLRDIASNVRGKATDQPISKKGRKVVKQGVRERGALTASAEIGQSR